MAKWSFEPGQPAAEFRARPMNGDYVRGHFKDVHGSLSLIQRTAANSSVEVRIYARKIWTGVKERDDHLAQRKLSDVEHNPEIHSWAIRSRLKASMNYAVTGDLTIRGVTRQVCLDVSYLGEWETPWWEDGVNEGPKTARGFCSSTKSIVRILVVSGKNTMDRGGIVVGNQGRYRHRC